jgi:hypothetical protein
MHPPAPPHLPSPVLCAAACARRLPPHPSLPRSAVELPWPAMEVARAEFPGRPWRRPGRSLLSSAPCRRIYTAPPLSSPARSPLASALAAPARRPPSRPATAGHLPHATCPRLAPPRAEQTKGARSGRRSE